MRKASKEVGRAFDETPAGELLLAPHEPFHVHDWIDITGIGDRCRTLLCRLPFCGTTMDGGLVAEEVA